MKDSEIQSLEAKGIETVLFEIAKGLHGDPGSRSRDQVEAWLRSKQVAADVLSSSRRDVREEETLAIAKEANSIAREANRAVLKDRLIAIAAVIIAAIAAREDIIWLISWLLKQITEGP